MGTPEGGAEWVPLWIRDAIGSSDLITNAQVALVAMVKDWKYDYGADDRHCSAMLLGIALRLHPEANIDQSFLRPKPLLDGLP